MYIHKKTHKIMLYTICCLLFFGLSYAWKTHYNTRQIITNCSNNTPSPSDKKVVYLTIDDGPSPVVTNQMLDVMKNNNVKATFFVVGKEIDGREEILKRIYDEGHSIGLHTYSHDFKKIYKSEDIFIDEMLKTQKKVEEVTGFKPTVLRFPGGSAGYLNKNFLDKIHKNNLKVYDWNVNLEDGVKPDLSVQQIIRNAEKCKKDNSRVIILMHCNFNNKNTSKALPSIINYYKELGYEFETITEDTKEYYYKFRKKH